MRCDILTLLSYSTFPLHFLALLPHFLSLSSFQYTLLRLPHSSFLFNFSFDFLFLPSLFILLFPLSYFLSTFLLHLPSILRGYFHATFSLSVFTQFSLFLCFPPLFLNSNYLSAFSPTLSVFLPISSITFSVYFSTTLLSPLYSIFLPFSSITFSVYFSTTLLSFTQRALFTCTFIYPFYYFIQFLF